MTCFRFAVAVLLVAVAGAAAPVSKRQTATAQAPPLLRTLNLHDRIAQLIVVRGYGDYPTSDNAEYKRFYRWIHEDHVGGFIVAGRIRDGNVIAAQPFQMAAFINHMQRSAKTPLLIASDFERGASMRVADTARFPYMMAFGAAHDTEAVRKLGALTAHEARALGVNWVFAPDADVNNNPVNPIINIRSFGEDPKAVADAVGAFIDGAHSDPVRYVLVSPKHFPGHGDTAEDSHMQLAKVDQPKERIESVELVPFRAAVEHRADSIMTAHLTVPAFEPQQLPATLSHNVLTGLLREELGYKGLIVTDAMEMQGVASLFSEGEAAVRAVEAGADVLLMPVNPEVCIKALQGAVTSGRISRQRIDASVSRILAAKQKVGLFRKKTVDLDALPDELRDPKGDELARRVAERSLTLVKDDKHLFPLPSSEGSCLVLMTEFQFSDRGELLVRALNKQAPGIKVYSVNPFMQPALLQAVASDAQQCKQIYVAAFVTVAANRGSVNLEGGLGDLLRTLSAGPVPLALISFGNPYLLKDYPSSAAYLATFSPAQSSETAVAAALLGQIPIGGRLPVSIPGIAKVGDGLDVAPRSTQASNGTR